MTSLSIIRSEVKGTSFGVFDDPAKKAISVVSVTSGETLDPLRKPILG
jgi:hypothetical protein